MFEINLATTTTKTTTTNQPKTKTNNTTQFIKKKNPTRFFNPTNCIKHLNITCLKKITIHVRNTTPCNPNFNLVLHFFR